MDIESVDAVLNEPRWAPRYGWHDDHAEKDRTPEYLPAMMQVRSEFAGLITVLRASKILGGRCLQLGMGECQASHAAWRKLFDRVVTIDFGCFADNDIRFPGASTHNVTAIDFALASGAPYDLLFIDAGHKLSDVRADYQNYGVMVRTGGIIAFHDALKRPGYEDEVDVWRFLETLKPPAHMIGSEVGIAWMRR